MDELDVKSYTTLESARLLLKMYDMDAQVVWRPASYSGWSRHRMKKPFVLKFGGIRWVQGVCNRNSQSQSHKHIISYKTAQNLMDGVKRLVTNSNV